ncbi:MAG: sigma-70 family RNA polymerase sigma factor [Pseudomonadota bacterium]|nr:sigma-70 family RNA polymerase sigma factor [Pseudomonadota bacterium]
MNIVIAAARSNAAEIIGLRPYLMRVALSRMRDHQAAEDVVQETLVAACVGQAGFNGRSRLRTWVTGILLHKVTDAFRALGREPAALPIDDAGEDPDFDRDGRWRAPPSAWSDPELALDCARFRGAFDEQLARLPPMQSRVFVMRELEGLEPDEICRTLGITPSNLWVLLHRARLGLRRGLDRAWFGREDVHARAPRRTI